MTITDFAMPLQISTENTHYFRFVVTRARIHRNVCPRHDQFTPQHGGRNFRRTVYICYLCAVKNLNGSIIYGFHTSRTIIHQWLRQISTPIHFPFPLTGIKNSPIPYYRQNSAFKYPPPALEGRINIGLADRQGMVRIGPKGRGEQNERRWFGRTP